ncbi:MAG: NAD+ synthase [Deltaproteobacteria bacterium]|nr:NAD+ synthase [Deltaproteobacteria bacterium]
MKILAAQLNPRVGDLARNTDRILAALDLGRASGVDLVVTPELALTGYPPRDLLDRPRLHEAIAEALLTLTRATVGGPALLVGLPLPHQTRPHQFQNAALLIDDGRILVRHNKLLLPSYDVFDEARHFLPGEALTTVTFRGRTLILSICEDLWACDDPTLRARYGHDPLDDAQPADLLINLSASPFARGKIERRLSTLATAAAKLQTPVLYLNQVGANDELIFDGNSLLMLADGTAKQLAPAFLEASTTFELGRILELPNLAVVDPVELTLQALVTGIRDYFHKSGFSRALLGLSGGIDSALTAALAVQALGPDNVIGLLMPSQFSSQGSLDDAAALAQNLGILTHTIPIEPAFRALRETLQPSLQNQTHGLTEENLQARIRAILLMAHANHHNALLLTTGNKSELAVGYCTLYGDMCGALAPIADLTKGRVWQLARHLNRDGILIPVNSIEKPPSAELRENQTDQDSLPPYELLDLLVEAYVERDCSPADLIRDGFDPDTVARVTRLIDLSEHKRRQTPPVLRVTEKAFGTGRRYPIASAPVAGL